MGCPVLLQGVFKSAWAQTSLLHLLQYEAAKNLTGRKCHDLLFAVVTLNCTDKGSNSRTPSFRCCDFPVRSKHGTKSNHQWCVPPLVQESLVSPFEQPAPGSQPKHITPKCHTQEQNTLLCRLSVAAPISQPAVRPISAQFKGVSPWAGPCAQQLLMRGGFVTGPCTRAVLSEQRIELSPAPQRPDFKRAVEDGCDLGGRP